MTTPRRMHRRRLLLGAAGAAAGAASLLTTARLPLPAATRALAPQRAAALTIAAPERFAEVWAVTDAAVADGSIVRTWFWGPQALVLDLEPYDEAPGRQRIVAYYDKGRMEDNTYRAAAPWDVTTGLLVQDLISGRLQVGDTRFEQRAPATLPVAGDADDPTGVTFAALAHLMDRPATPPGTFLTERIDANGAVSNDPTLADLDIFAARHVPETGHSIANVFDAFIRETSGAWYGSDFYITGFPLTEAYWTTARVGGTPRLVLLQPFERRVLTYTPDNPPGWQVEMGNVGQQYLAWRNAAPAEMTVYTGNRWRLEQHPEASFTLWPHDANALDQFGDALQAADAPYELVIRLTPSVTDAAARYALDATRFSPMLLRDGQRHTHNIGQMYGRSREIVAGPFTAAYKQQADITNFLDRDNALKNHVIANALIQMLGDDSEATHEQRSAWLAMLAPHLAFIWRQTP